MIKSRLKIYTLTEEAKENHALAEWIWDSHNWVEYHAGYWKCDWCGAKHTSVQPIFADMPLCENNPAIRKLVNTIGPLCGMEAS